ncbi:tagaturonate epimerase family protein [Marinilactibacillus sp. XAAS-LB27]|uniref:tagaturonate epimerase family protein n=1 Tax=Marinilactibacillus sp. XAAS-LB27 TaxID=3114538 RepID=UPI002E17B996|nr:tagaturonate epimerase family protein [Marinilactibacillus sp. XAAS-LB27]
MKIKEGTLRELLNTKPAYTLYERSFKQLEDSEWAMVKEGLEKKLLVSGKQSVLDQLEGEMISEQIKLCPTNYQNRLVLNKYFDWTVPKAFGNKVTTIGLGDRLGLASPGHISAIRDKKAKPILAQQSIRELTLMDRTIDDIVDAASYAVFQEDYQDGFGADGDHLKEEADIKRALDAGMTMLTLDCSDHIENAVANYTKEEVQAHYDELPEDERTGYEKRYLDQTFHIHSFDLSFSKEALMFNVLLYKKALDFTVFVFDEYVQKANQEIDFELSIDETETVTSPASHFFVANELAERGVKVNSLAPRFIGEFQKGVDYMGELDQFEADFKQHAEIAKTLDYKISIHSGSDKFSVFPIIGNHTEGLFHLKTAGTNWLEAMRVLAQTEPELYRKMHSYAFEHFPEAQKYYHITPDLSGIPGLDKVNDAELPEYLNDRNARQVLHVTYGVLLTAETNEGQPLFKNIFFEKMKEREEEYRRTLTEHIGKHLETLRIPNQ